MSYIVTVQTQAPASAQSQADRTTKLLDPKVAIPPIGRVNLPSTLATWPRIEWSTVKFTYPDFLFMSGMLQEKFQWTARDASRAWDEAMKLGNLDYALAPAQREHLQPGTTEYDKAVELSLSLAYADKALQLNHWARSARSVYKIRYVTADDWYEGKWGLDQVLCWAWNCYICALGKVKPLHKHAWLYSDELFQRLYDFGEDVLHRFWEPALHSMGPPPNKPEWVDEAAYLQPWYPDPTTVPKQPLVLFGFSETARRVSAPRYVDVLGQYYYSERTAKEAEEARSWWKRYGNQPDLLTESFPVYGSESESASL